MRSLAQRDLTKRTYYDKQRGPERTLYKAMSLNDGDGGDIGYIFYSNLTGQRTTQKEELPILEEKVRFSELKGLGILGLPKVLESKEIEVCVRPGEEVIYLMKKSSGNEPASYKAQFFPRLNHRAACSEDEVKRLGKKS
jgi:hypothetical protein